MKKLFVYCAGGLGAETVAVAKRINQKTETFSSIEYIDDTKDNQPINSVASYTYETFLKVAKKEDCVVVISNGEPFVREKIFQKVKADGFSFATLIDPFATVCTDEIGEGAVIMSGACVSPNAKIEENVVLYYNAVVAHDAIVKKHSLLSIGATLSGHCEVGERTFIGAGAILREKVKVGNDAVVGTGSLALKDVDDFSVAFGTPAKKIRTNQTQRVFK